MGSYKKPNPPVASFVQPQDPSPQSRKIINVQVFIFTMAISNKNERTSCSTLQWPSFFPIIFTSCLAHGQCPVVHIQKCYHFPHVSCVFPPKPSGCPYRKDGFYLHTSPQASPRLCLQSITNLLLTYGGPIMDDFTLHNISHNGVHDPFWNRHGWFLHPQWS